MLREQGNNQKSPKGKVLTEKSKTKGSAEKLRRERGDNETPNLKGSGKRSVSPESPHEKRGNKRQKFTNERFVDENQGDDDIERLSDFEANESSSET